MQILKKNDKSVLVYILDNLYGFMSCWNKIQFLCFPVFCHLMASDAERARSQTFFTYLLCPNKMWQLYERGNKKEQRRIWKFLKTCSIFISMLLCQNWYTKCWLFSPKYVSLECMWNIRAYLKKQVYRSVEAYSSFKNVWFTCCVSNTEF